MVALAGCQLFFGVELPDESKVEGAGGLDGTAGVAGSAGAGCSGMGAAGLGAGGTGGGSAVECTAPQVDCGGTCVDIKATDAANCGACGRSCLGTATCAAGVCVPEVMASNEVAPYALVDDGTYLYWVSPAIKGVVDTSKMRRVAKASAGGAAQNMFESTRVRARSLGFDGTKLYWGDLGATPNDNSQRVTSGTPSTGDCCTTIEPAQLNVQHLVVVGGNVYWTIGAASAVRGDRDDGTGPVAPNVSGQDSVGWLAVDEEAKPYWLAGGPREVRRLAASPENTAEKVADSASGLAVELAGGRVYWTDGATSAIRSAAKTEPLPTTGREEFSGRGTIEGFRVEVAGTSGAAGAGGDSGAGGAGDSGAGGAGGSGDGAPTLYVVTTAGQRLRVWRRGPDDAEPLLLGEVATKAAEYTGNPLGATYVLTDEKYVYFADVGTVDTGQLVPVSTGDGVVYRVAK